MPGDIPLTWSHATFIIAVQRYLKKLEEMEKCPACGALTRSFTRLPGHNNRERYPCYFK